MNSLLAFKETFYEGLEKCIKNAIVTDIYLKMNPFNGAWYYMDWNHINGILMTDINE